MSIRPRDILFYGGGECLQKFGTPVWRMRRDQDGAGTFTRPTGTGGSFTGRDGVLRKASVDRPRIEWEYDAATGLFIQPGLLIESPAFTNLVDEDDLAQWTQTNSPTTTGGQSDPAGGTGAFTIEDDGGGAIEFIQHPISGFDDGAVNVVCFVVRENTMASSGNQSLRLYDLTDDVDRLTLTITGWSAGEPQITASNGTHLGSVYKGDGFWHVFGLTTAVTEANTNRARIVPAATASATGSIDAYRANAFAGLSPPWSILDASETKDAETFYADFPHVPQAMCGLVDFRELENPNWTTQGGTTRRLMNISDASGSKPHFGILRPDGTDNYRVFHGVGANTVISNVDLNPSWGDRVQLFWWLYADGSVNIAGRTQALGSTTWSAITTGSQSAALALDDAWSDTRLYLGSVGLFGRGSQNFFKSLVVAGSDHARDELLDVFVYDAARAV